jgi:outer membrane biosynthesis protein TonB
LSPRLSATAAGRRRPRPSRRLNWALSASLLVHALLLSLSFGDGLGLPGLELPWQKRRAEVPELRVVLAASLPPLPSTPLDEPGAAQAGEPAAPAAAEHSAGEGLAAAEVRMLPPDEMEVPELAPPAHTVLAATRPAAADWAMQAASAVPTAAVAVMAGASSPAVEALARVSEALRPRSEVASQLSTLEIRSPDAVVAAFAAASGPVVESLRRASDSLRLRAERPSELQDAAHLDARALPSAVVSTLAGSAGVTVEALRRGSESQRPRVDVDRSAELAQLDAARQQAQQGAQRLEATRLEALRQEAARAEAARLEAARQEAARADAVRQEAARLEDARQEAARAAAAKLAAAQAQAQAEEEQREARKRAIGRQLDAEAAQRDAERKRPDWAPARRGRLLGRTDANAELAAYGETWARKIESNLTTETVREVARQPHTDAIVTVAVRSNGSVEGITFVRSSGVPAVDDAIARIVRSQENYPAFAPALLRDYDVVEIRRTWHFDMAVRLY